MSRHDFALHALDATETQDLYALVIERHHNAATVLTSNRDPSEWLAVMADPLLDHVDHGPLPVVQVGLMSRMMSAKLTPTTYAILGLLCIRPWTAYELAAQMQRGWRFSWPRARSGIFEEPKKLVAHGYASAVTEARRTVYEVTPAGRAAFRDWLDSEPTEPRFEWDGLLHVAFADLGTKEQLLATLAAMRAQAESDRAEMAEQAAGYVADSGGPFPERRHLMVLMGDLINRQVELLVEWTTWAEDEVARWPDTTAPYSDRVLRKRLKAVADRAAR